MSEIQSRFDPFSKRTWSLAHGRRLEIGPHALIMGIVNVTPDSFSDGGKHFHAEQAVSRALEMHQAGADIVDVGGESTRPGADPVSASEEEERVLPVIEALSKNADLIISIDTYRAQTAEKAVQAGAHIINDVWGCQKEPQIASVAARHGAGLCAMHTGRERDRRRDVVADHFEFLEASLEIIQNAGVNHEQIVLDPGFGFAKDPQENIELLGRFEELLKLGYPILVGTSRKRFLGHITGKDAEDRDIATAATSVVARMKGAAVFRVHDVTANRDSLLVTDAVLQGSGGNE